MYIFSSTKILKIGSFLKMLNLSKIGKKCLTQMHRGRNLGFSDAQSDFMSIHEFKFFHCPYLNTVPWVYTSQKISVQTQAFWWGNRVDQGWESNRKNWLNRFSDQLFFNRFFRFTKLNEIKNFFGLFWTF